MDADDIASAALQLNRRARAQLARLLLTSLESLAQEELDTIWPEEAIARDADVLSEDIPASIAFDRARADLR